MNVEKWESDNLSSRCGLLLAGYVAFIIYGSLVPWTFHYVPFGTAWDLYISRLSTSLAITSRSNFAANILLFIPLTFLAMGTLGRKNSRWVQGPMAAVFLVLAGILGGGIEYLQVYVPARTVSLNDVLAQLIGGAVGILFWFLLGRRLTQWAGRLWREHVGEDTAVKFLLGYAAVFIAWKLFPLDLTISLHDIYQTLKHRTCFVPFTDRENLSAVKLVVNILSYIPIGVLLGRAFRRKGWGLIGMVVCGCLAAAMVEGLQFFAEGHCPSMTDVVLGTVGSAIGIIPVMAGMRPGRPEPKKI
jgi:VanZ family protein